MSKLEWILRQLSGKLWIRSALFCVLGAATALVAFLVKDLIPQDVPRKIGADAVDSILHIIANSMLAVTTFSLSTMVSAYGAATSNVTPRATQLLLRDRTSQNALSVFVGAFLFSLVGIVALSIGLYGESGRVVLFVVTVGVILLIVAVMLQWINYLSRFGRVSETIDLVEKVTAQAIGERIKEPYLGGKKLHTDASAAGSYPVRYGKIGYVQHLDMSALSKLCGKIHAEFFLCMTPGAFNDGAKPLFYSSVAMDDEAIQVACRAYTIGDDRSFEQDPRFGVIVLCEVASRALSPAVNDPGTAIDIINTSVRVLAPWVSRHDTPDPDPIYPAIHVRPLATADLFDDIYGPIVRDGSGMVQVAVKVQKAMASLARMGDAETKTVAVRVSEYAFAHAKEALRLPDDKETIRSLAEAVREV
ncbi:hypothetical protein F183_A26920 [Bryobacterales bacterium F-183]|nr:hypothetical protein F183_A26920 [Bryobacterales bacterium F-183]